MRQATEAAEAAEARWKVALVLEYDGTAYAGFQRQANAPSVQATTEEAWRLLTGSVDRLKGAGRTDAGVHATGQVVAFETTSALSTVVLQRGLNHYLPADIAVTEAYEAPMKFHPRRDALSRVYRYTLLSRRSRSPLRRRAAYLVGRPVDVATMQECLAYLEGVRDFAPFSGPVDEGATTIRRLFRTAVWREEDEVHLEMEGNAFLPQQVRRTVGAVLQVGVGKETVQAFKAQADSGRRGAAHWVVPPSGLCLRQVNYKGFPSRSYARQQNNQSYVINQAGPTLAGR